MESMGRTLSSVHLPILDELSDLLIYEMKRYYVEVFNQTPSSNCWTNWTRDGKGQKMTGTLSSNCRRIYFAAQEFSNWVTEYNSDITNLRYTFFFTTNGLVPVLGKYYRSRDYTTAELERLYRRISSSPKLPVQSQSKRIIVA